MQICAEMLPAISVLRAMRRLFPARGWERLFRILFNPDQQNSFEFELPFFEFTYLGDVSIYLDWTVLFYGCYERDDIILMRKLLTKIKNAVALDIGANVGHHTLAMAALCSEVHAFEPYDAMHKIMQRRLKSNSISNVDIHPFGLGEKSAELKFAIPAIDDRNKGTARISANGSILIDVKRGDDLNLGHIDFIKLDVEGHELAVLDGLRETIRRDRPSLLIELNHDLRQISARLPRDYLFFQHRIRSRVMTNCYLEPVIDSARTMQHGNVFAIPAERAVDLA